MNNTNSTASNAEAIIEDTAKYSILSALIAGVIYSIAILV